MSNFDRAPPKDHLRLHVFVSYYISGLFSILRKLLRVLMDFGKIWRRAKLIVLQSPQYTDSIFFTDWRFHILNFGDLQTFRKKSYERTRSDREIPELKLLGHQWVSMSEIAPPLTVGNACVLYFFFKDGNILYFFFAWCSMRTEVLRKGSYTPALRQRPAKCPILNLLLIYM